MDYTINSHDDSNRTINITVKGHEIIANYPEDIESYDQFTEESLALYLSGILAPYAHMDEYQEPEQAQETPTEWF